MISTVLEKEKKRFKKMTEHQFTEIAQTALQKMMQRTDAQNPDSVSGLFICITASLKLGFCTGSLSQRQKQFMIPISEQRSKEKQVEAPEIKV